MNLSSILKPLSSAFSSVKSFVSNIFSPSVPKSAVTPSTVGMSYVSPNFFQSLNQKIESAVPNFYQGKNQTQIPKVQISNQSKTSTPVTTQQSGAYSGIPGVNYTPANYTPATYIQPQSTMPKQQTNVGVGGGSTYQKYSSPSTPSMLQSYTPSYYQAQQSQLPSSSVISQQKPQSQVQSQPINLDVMGKNISNAILTSLNTGQDLVTPLYSQLYNLLPEEKKVSFLKPEEFSSVIGETLAKQTSKIQKETNEQKIQQQQPEDLYSKYLERYQKLQQKLMPSEDVLRQRFAEEEAQYKEDLEKLLEDIKGSYAAMGFSPYEPIVQEKLAEIRLKGGKELARLLSEIRRQYEEQSKNEAMNIAEQVFGIEKLREQANLEKEKTLASKMMDIYRDIVAPQSTDITNYRFAVQQGFTGSFADFIGEKNAPSEWKQYQMAKQEEGYSGGFMDFLQDIAQAKKDPTAQALAALAVQGRMSEIMTKPLDIGMKIADQLNQDPNVKSYEELKSLFNVLSASKESLQRNPKNRQLIASYDQVLSRIIARLADPRTGVREEEVRMYAGISGSDFITRSQAAFQVLEKGGTLPSQVRSFYESIASSLSKAIRDRAIQSYSKLKESAKNYGADLNLIIKQDLEPEEIEYNGERYRGFRNLDGSWDLYEKLVGGQWVKI